MEEHATTRDRQKLLILGTVDDALFYERQDYGNNALEDVGLMAIARAMGKAIRPKIISNEAISHVHRYMGPGPQGHGVS